MSGLTAKSFLKDLSALAAESGRKGEQAVDTYDGVRMGAVFALAKTCIDMPLDEIEALLESPIHKARVGSVSIMDFQARAKKTTEAHKKALFDLYMRRHDRINTWDLVDRSAIYVVGGYLMDKPRARLYKLARSAQMAERRTAIVSTLYFIMKGDTADTFKIAEMLLQDKEDLVHKGVGWALRAAGGPELVAFLDAHAAHMPRVMLRYAIEKFPVAQRKEYLSRKEK